MTIMVPLFRYYPYQLKSQYTSPYTTLALIPQTVTGPAMANIFVPMPRTRPFACIQFGPITEQILSKQGKAVRTSN